MSSSAALKIPDDPRLGTIVGGRYAVLDLLGHGSMGRVYLAQDRLVPRQVALKVLNHDGPVGDVVRERFLLGACAVMHLEHPNIVNYLDAGETEDGLPYLVMERLCGETLHEFLEREGSMDQLLALGLFRQAASGLAAAHAAGVVHRDVKPDNLFLVGAAGAPEELKLLDFGLAKTAEATACDAGMVMGTREYMAPEQVVDEPVDERTDVYGLGVTMFRALTGELPFEAPRSTGVLAHQVHSIPPPAVWFVDDLLPGLADVVAVAMRKSPLNRFATMEAFEEALAGVAYGLPTPTPPLVDVPDRYRASTELGDRASRLLSQVLNR